MPDAESRTNALDWAGRARAVRYRLREDMRSGVVGLEEVLKLASDDALVGRVKLLWALESLPEAKKVTTRRRLANLKIDEGHRLGDLSDTEAEQVLAAFDRPAGPGFDRPTGSGKVWVVPSTEEPGAGD